MKCIRRDEVTPQGERTVFVERVSDHEAAKLVAGVGTAYYWVYCSKSEWRKAGKP